MAKYTINLTVDGANVKQVQAKLKEVFSLAEVSAVKKVKPPAKSRADRLGEAEGQVQEALSIVQELQEEMENWHDSIPENLQSGSKASEVEEAKDALESLASDLENLDFSSVNFPGMF